MKQNKLFNVIISAALTAAILCGCGKESVETTSVEMPEAQTGQTVAVTETQSAAVQLSVEAVEEQGDMVTVKTTFCQIKYPLAFADLVQVNAVDHGEMATLDFYAMIAGQEHPLFTLYFGGSEGILLGELEVSDEAEARMVYAELFQADTSALDNNVSTFYAAQECFNDVVSSLAENPLFAAAE